jgi:hypothetical protein
VFFIAATVWLFTVPDDILTSGVCNINMFVIVSMGDTGRLAESLLIVSLSVV